MITIYYGYLMAQISAKKAEKYGLSDGQNVDERTFHKLKRFVIIK